MVNGRQPSLELCAAGLSTRLSSVALYQPLEMKAGSMYKLRKSRPRSVVPYTRPSSDRAEAYNEPL